MLHTNGCYKTCTCTCHFCYTIEQYICSMNASFRECPHKYATLKQLSEIHWCQGYFHKK